MTLQIVFTRFFCFSFFVTFCCIRIFFFLIEIHKQQRWYSLLQFLSYRCYSSVACDISLNIAFDSLFFSCYCSCCCCSLTLLIDNICCCHGVLFSRTLFITPHIFNGDQWFVLNMISIFQICHFSFNVIWQTVVAVIYKYEYEFVFFFRFFSCLFWNQEQTRNP